MYVIGYLNAQFMRRAFHLRTCSNRHSLDRVLKPLGSVYIDFIGSFVLTQLFSVARHTKCFKLGQIKVYLGCIQKYRNWNSIYKYSNDQWMKRIFFRLACMVFKHLNTVGFSLLQASQNSLFKIVWRLAIVLHLMFPTTSSLSLKTNFQLWN